MIALGLDDPRWLEFVRRRPSATPFHHPSWAMLLARCYGYRGFVLAVLSGHGRVLAGLPIIEARGLLRRTRWVSLPYTDQCPVLTADGVSEATVVGELDAVRRQSGVSSLEIRGAIEGAAAHAGQVAITHRLALDGDPDVVFHGSLRASVRKWVTRAERDGVVVRRAQAPSALTEAFYGLHLRTRRRLGVPVQPRRYFRLLWEQVIEPGLGFVLLAHDGTTPVAGAVFLAWNGTVTYKYGASDTAAWHLHPNHLVMWDAIRWACEHGFRTFDFGRSDPGSKGLRQFKASWGAHETPLIYTAVGGGPVRPLDGRLHAVLGSVIRRAPPLACRAAGELLYRYAA